MKELLKRILPNSMRRKLRVFNRFRWIAKWRLLKFWEFDIAAHPARSARYIFLDPETESYTYEISNESALCEFAAAMVGVPVATIEAWMSEAKRDPLLNRDRGFAFTHKRRLPLGYRLAWYVMVRGLKPKLVVEAGIHQGRGSEVLLRALEKNVEEGCEGRLLSIDMDADTGELVHPSLHSRWNRVVGSTRTALEPALTGQEVDIFIHDIPHFDEPFDMEFELVYRHAAPRLVIIDSIGKHHALPDFCRKREGVFSHFVEAPLDHFIQPSGSAYGVFQRPQSQASFRGIARSADTAG